MSQCHIVPLWRLLTLPLQSDLRNLEGIPFNFKHGQWKRSWIRVRCRCLATVARPKFCFVFQVKGAVGGAYFDMRMFMTCPTTSPLCLVSKLGQSRNIHSNITVRHIYSRSTIQEHTAYTKHLTQPIKYLTQQIQSI